MGPFLRKVLLDIFRTLIVRYNKIISGILTAVDPLALQTNYMAL